MRRLIEITVDGGFSIIDKLNGRFRDKSGETVLIDSFSTPGMVVLRC